MLGWTGELIQLNYGIRASLILTYYLRLDIRYDIQRDWIGSGILWRWKTYSTCHGRRT